MYGCRAGELRCDSRADMLIALRDLETIDSELRLLAAVRRVCPGRWYKGNY